MRVVSMGSMVIPLKQDQEKGNLYRIENVCGSKSIASNSMAIATVSITTMLDAVFLLPHAIHILDSHFPGHHWAVMSCLKVTGYR